MPTKNWLEAAPAPTTSPPRGFDRAAVEQRLPAFDGGPSDARQRLARAVVSIVGLGSVGRPMAEQLARVGVGTLHLIDRGIIKPHSLLTHASTTPSDLGQPKALNTAALCRQIRPEANILIFDGAIENLPPAALLDSDVILLASDNLAAEVCVGQYCAWLVKPLIELSVHGETMIAQARILINRAPGGGPCPRCAFGQAEEQHLRSGQHFSCDGGGAVAAQPTMSTSSLCGIAASMGSTLALRHILGLGAALSDSMQEWCGYTAQTWSGPLRRRDDCPSEHRAWEIVRASRALGELSLREAGRVCAIEWSPDVQLEVDEFVFPDPAAAATTTMPPPNRFVDADVLPRVFCRRRVHAALLQHIAHQPLAQIAPAPPRWVKAFANSRTCLLANPANAEQP
jgi:molybdopterin/thiamine biosynthesis adenylyltransferase